MDGGRHIRLPLSAFRFDPFGTHTIHIVRFDPDGVSSREGNEHVPVWNHDIRLIEKDENHTQYTDQVEIHAGWKTAYIWLWANAFYRHRQRKWIRLLRRKKRSTGRIMQLEGNARETS